MITFKTIIVMFERVKVTEIFYLSNDFYKEFTFIGTLSMTDSSPYLFTSFSINRILSSVFFASVEGKRLTTL